MKCILNSNGRTGIAIAIGLAMASVANAQDGLDRFQQPIGFAFGQQNQNATANTRDANGNRLVVNGQIIGSSDLSNFSGSRFGRSGGVSGLGGQSTAIGNQLNVITQGNNNIVVIDSTQTNNGDQNIILNGEINLDD